MINTKYKIKIINIYRVCFKTKRKWISANNVKNTFIIYNFIKIFIDFI